MARTRRIKKDSDAHYHLMSRTNDRRFLFESGEVKSELVSALRRAAEFCGVEIKAYAAMDNHFHVVVKVTKPDEPVCADELLRRVGVLKGEKAMHALEERWDEMLAAGLDAALKAEQDKLRARMHDISEFMKLFKEMFDRVYKRGRAYCGSIWSGRFASTLVQGGEHLARCKRYVVYNPVRAGIVAQAREYRWSWCEEDVAPAAGGDWCLRRVVQIGAGVVFGDEAFVLATAFALGDRFHSGGAGAHPAGDVGWSTHGWRLAAAARRISCRNKAQARQK